MSQLYQRARLRGTTLSLAHRSVLPYIQCTRLLDTLDGSSACPSHRRGHLQCTELIDVVLPVVTPVVTPALARALTAVLNTIRNRRPRKQQKKNRRTGTHRRK
jgi:hypothetical protein